jgi:hypothetical protein
MEVAKKHNLDGYGTPPIAWERVRDMLTADITQVPGTGGPDRPDRPDRRVQRAVGGPAAVARIPDHAGHRVRVRDR